MTCRKLSEKQLEKRVKPRLLEYRVLEVLDYHAIDKELGALYSLNPKNPAVILYGALEKSLKLKNAGKMILNDIFSVDFFSDPDYFIAATAAMSHVLEEAVEKGLIEKKEYFSFLRRGISAFPGDLKVIGHISNLCYSGDYILFFEEDLYMARRFALLD